jgi:hypothetical protein
MRTATTKEEEKVKAKVRKTSWLIYPTMRKRKELSFRPSSSIDSRKTVPWPQRHCRL